MITIAISMGTLGWLGRMVVSSMSLGATRLYDSGHKRQAAACFHRI